MPDNARDNLLARLAGKSTPGGDGPSWATISTTQPQHAQGASRVVPDEPVSLDAGPAPTGAASTSPAKEGAEGRLEHLLKRISTLAVEQGAARAQAAHGAAATNGTASPGGQAPGTAAPGATRLADAFVPIEPQTWAEAQLTEAQVEAIILKFLLARGVCTGREAADQVKLPFKLIDELMRQLKADQLVVYTGTAPMNDYSYQLTDMGRERARRYTLECTYFGSAPVSLADYIASVKAQALTLQHPTTEDLRMAFQDLLINKHMLDRLGPAINSGRGLFLYGAPGNGKTSIAERITMAFGDAIWIPRAIGIDGEIIRLFDPSNHEELPLEQSVGLLDQRRIDKRWIRIRRPTIVVGGELTMANLEVTLNTSTGISEASLQMKSNCGTLVIDDFGRQRMRTDELLNRWIVPLEKRYDYLNLPNGKKIQVPFDQLIVFSTNLQPKDLVDDAFLRRIPYKIDVTDPSEDEFRELFRLMAPKLGMEYRGDAVDYLIDKYYRRVKRPFRCCQPRDLLTQVRNYCLYKNIRPEITADYFDVAVENYFAVM